MPPEDEFEALLAQLYGYGVSPESVASSPLIPNSYVENKWNQDAGTYVPTDMPYSKPSTRLWHAQTAMDMLLDPQFAALGGAMGLPTQDYLQPFEEPEPAATPYLDSLRGSSNEVESAIGEDIASGMGKIEAKARARQLIEDEERLKDTLDVIEQAYDEQITAASGVSEGSSSSGGDSEGYNWGGDLTPVERAYAEAGLPKPWEEYTAETLPERYTPNIGKVQKQQARKGERFLKTVERFIEQSSKREKEDVESRTAAQTVLDAFMRASGDAEREVGVPYPVGHPQNSQTQQDYWSERGAGSVGDALGGVFDSLGLGADLGPQSDEPDYSFFAGGSPESHRQIAEQGSQFAAQNHEDAVKTATAKLVTAQGHTPTNDSMQARIALARLIGVPI